MSNDILIIDGNYHIGDNFGVYQTATFIGIKIALPMKKTWVSDESNNISFVFHTAEVETWAEWQGHKISINGTEIGHIKDNSNETGDQEISIINVDKNKFTQLLNEKDNFILEIELGRQESMPGFSDDFRLLRVSSRNIAITIG